MGLFHLPPVVDESPLLTIVVWRLAAGFRIFPGETMENVMCTIVFIIVCCPPVFGEVVADKAPSGLNLASLERHSKKCN